MLNLVKRITSGIALASLLVLALTGCIFGPSLPQERQFQIHGMTFNAPVELKLEEYTFDVQRGIFQKGPSHPASGVLMSTHKNFILEWTYAPEFTPELARRQVLNGPAFFGPPTSVTLVASPATRQISNFAVTFSELRFKFSPNDQSPGVIGVWYCPKSQRAIIHIAFYKRPLLELDRFVESFSCS